MADKGCVALDWDHEAQGLPEDAPIVILMPGKQDYIHPLGNHEVQAPPEHDVLFVILIPDARQGFPVASQGSHDVQVPPGPDALLPILPSISRNSPHYCPHHEGFSDLTHFHNAAIRAPCGSQPFLCQVCQDRQPERCQGSRLGSRGAWGEKAIGRGKSAVGSEPAECFPAPSCLMLAGAKRKEREGQEGS
eukprot:scaffold67536_cov20-Tisochrysis_lutea.AAC.2